MLYYGVEAWTLTDTMKRLKALEIWCYRLMLGIPRTCLVTNEKTLTQTNKEKEVLINARKKNLSYFGKSEEERDTGY